MRLAALLLLFVGCAPAKPLPPREVSDAPKEVDAGAPVAESADASTSAAAPVAANEPCSPHPCRVSDRAIEIAADGNDVVFLRTFGLKGGPQLLKRGPNDKEDVILAADIRPSRTTRVRRPVVDKDAIFFATSEGVASWERNGVLTLIGPQSSGAEHLAVDDTNVYFMGNECTLRKVPKTGGTVEELVKHSAGYCGPPHIAVDDTNVYFTADEMVFAIARTPKGRGKPAKRVVMSRTEQRSILGLTVDDANVYVLLGPSGITGVGKGKLVRVSRKGGPAVELAKTEPANNVHSLGSDATRLYWLEGGQGKTTLMSMTKPGGEKKPIGEAPGIGYGMAVGKDNVFFVAWETTGPGSTPRIWRVTK